MWTKLGLTITATLLGALVGHLLTKNRNNEIRYFNLKHESELRKRSFRKEVLTYRYILERIPHTEDSKVWGEYVDFAPMLLASAELVKGDFEPEEKFASLVEAAGHWRFADAKKKATETKKDLRDILRDSLVDLYEFTIKK